MTREEACTIVASQAAHCLTPWLVEEARKVVQETEPHRDGLELELLLGNLCAALQRVKKTDPGSGDLEFIRSVRGRRVEKLTQSEITRLMAVRWKYRWALPEGLRPISPPG
jgi:hypothetical protein